MSKNRIIRISGRPRETLDADLLAQLVVMFGRQLAAEAEASASSDEQLTPPAPGAATA